MNALNSQHIASWSATHPTTAEDKVAMATLPMQEGATP